MFKKKKRGSQGTKSRAYWKRRNEQGKPKPNRISLIYESMKKSAVNESEKERGKEKEEMSQIDKKVIVQPIKESGR